MTPDELIRFGVDRVKYHLIESRNPPYTLPADSFIEVAVREIIQEALKCPQCGCNHASAYELGRADERLIRAAEEKQ